jgi:hypothetical protein
VAGETYTLGLDLGTASNPSALALLESVEGDGEGAEQVHRIVHLQRWPLKVKYGTVVEEVSRLLTSPPQPPAPFEPLVLEGSALVIDATGVGRPVFESFEEARLPARLVGAVITGGFNESFEDGFHRVPKRALAGVLQLLIQSRRLRQAPGLEHGPTLEKELKTFTAKINIATGNDSYEAWREKDTDDIVLAVALAAWWAEQNAGGGGRPLDLTRRPNDPPPLWRQGGGGLFGRP